MASKELTPVQALERLHSGTDGLVLPDPNGPPWLNTTDVVDGIVRTWASDMLTRFADLEEAPFMQWLESQCLLMNQLFLGYQPDEKRTDYQRSPWNMPQNLGRSIGPNMQFDAETHHAVRDAFMLTAAALVELTTENAGKPVEQWGWQMDAEVEALRNGLLGLPVIEE